MAAGVLLDETPLTVTITVASDVSIGESSEGNIDYSLSDGTNLVGFETCDQWNKGIVSCLEIKATSGTSN